MKKKLEIDILFVLLDIGLTIENSSVFQSQIGNQLVALKSMGFKVGLITNYQNNSLFNSVIGDKLINNGVFVRLFKSKSSFILNFLLMIFELRKLKFNINTSYYYFRGFWGPLALKLAFPLTNLNYIYDLRGDLESEMLAIKTNFIKRKIYLLLERIAVKNSKNVTAVTSSLAELAKKKFEKQSVTVIPCCINYKNHHVDSKKITEIKNNLGFHKEDLIFVYSGGLSHYQKVPEMLSLWKLFLKDENIKFLLLTNQDPHSHPITVKSIECFGNRLKHINLKQNEVKNYLVCCDVGFLLRDSVPLNLSASPVKFPEYLAAGLKVISSFGLGDISDLILVNKIGVLVNPNEYRNYENEVKNLIINIRNSNKNKIRDRSKFLAKQYYDWNTYKEKFNQLYLT